MITWLIWTIWNPMSSVPRKADKLNLSLSLNLDLSLDLLIARSQSLSWSLSSSLLISLSWSLSWSLLVSLLISLSWSLSLNLLISWCDHYKMLHISLHSYKVMTCVEICSEHMLTNWVAAKCYLHKCKWWIKNNLCDVLWGCNAYESQLATASCKL